MKRATKLIVVNLLQDLFELRFQRQATYTTSHRIHLSKCLVVGCVVPRLRGITIRFQLELHMLVEIRQPNQW